MTMVKKKRSIQETVEVEEPVAVEEATSTSSLRSSLDQIKAHEGVIGYILRNATSASIDLKDPAKIVDYAILSSSALDASKELTSLLELGDPRSVIVEGKSSKMLSVVVGDNKISVFMEKSVDSEAILRKLSIA
jgi:predicted regulator of Ras-like GTPase activity (Roadblock/LC7/MglB family)